MSAGITIQVEKQNVGGGTNNWVYYKHSSGSGFTLGKITHSDVPMTDGAGGKLTADMKKEINAQGAIYVYYSNSGNDLDKPKVICISEDGTAAKSKWYVAVSSATNWKADTTNFDGKTPEGSGGDVVTQTQLDKATESSSLTVEGIANYVIKLDKRPKLAVSTNNIKYRTKNIDVTVEKTEGSSDPGSKVPDGYVRYAHTPNNPISETITYKHNGIQLTFVPPVTGTVEAVYVYYRGGTDDPNHEFPLIVCVKKTTGSTPTQTYYKRGNTWNVENDLNGVNPESPNNSNPSGLDTLRTKLDGVKGKFEVKLEKTNLPSPGKYIARPGTQTTDKITVSPVTEQTSGSAQAKYKGYKHTIPDISKKINRITIYNQVAEGIPQTVLNDFTFESGGGVFVYFELKNNNPDLKRPLLICLSKDGTKSNSESGGNNKWYRRNYNQSTGNTWADVTSSYGDIKPAEGNKIDSKLVEKLQTISQELTDAKDEGYPKPVSVKLFIHFNTWKRSTGAGGGSK